MKIVVSTSAPIIYNGTPDEIVEFISGLNAKNNPLNNPFKDDTEESDSTDDKRECVNKNELPERIIDAMEEALK